MSGASVSPAILAALPQNGTWRFAIENYGVVATDTSGNNPQMLVIGTKVEPLVVGVNAPPFRATKHLSGK